MLYSNEEPGPELKKELCLPGASEYGGSLNPVQLKERLNTSDILVFAESFDPEQEEKVRYSLSTKVPEYMSTGRAILAIGPESVGSVSYLRDVAACVSSADQMDEVLFRLLEDPELREQLGSSSRGKYLRNHDRAVLQRQFVQDRVGKAAVRHCDAGSGLLSDRVPQRLLCAIETHRHLIITAFICKLLDCVGLRILRDQYQERFFLPNRVLGGEAAGNDLSGPGRQPQK